MRVLDAYLRHRFAWLFASLRALAVLEAVVGQLYVAVLIARLVTLYGRERSG